MLKILAREHAAPFTYYCYNSSAECIVGFRQRYIMSGILVCVISSSIYLPSAAQHLCDERCAEATNQAQKEEGSSRRSQVSKEDVAATIQLV